MGILTLVNFFQFSYLSLYYNSTALSFLRVLQNLSQVNIIINSQNSLGDLNAAAHVQQAAMWQIYGKE